MNSNKNITTFKDEENKDELLKRKELEIEKNPIKQEAIRNYYGIALALMSALFLSLSVIFFKKAKFFSGSDQATVRYAIQLIIMVSVARYRQLKLFGAKEQRKLLIIRGIFGMCGLIFLHFSIKLIDPSDSASLLHTNVIIISILARLFLGEKLTVAHIISIIATVAGVFLISQPSFLLSNFNNAHNLAVNMSQSNQSVTETQNNHSNLNYLVGISIALLAAMCSSVVTIVLKKLSNQSVHYSITIAYAAYFGLPISLLISILSYLTGLTKKDLSILSDQVEFLSQIGFSLLSALFGTFSQILMNVSLNYEDASKVSLFRSTDVFFAFILQYFFLNIHSNMFSIIGALLILIGTVLILVYKQIDRVLSKKSEADRNRIEKCILLRF